MDVDREQHRDRRRARGLAQSHVRILMPRKDPSSDELKGAPPAEAAHYRPCGRLEWYAEQESRKVSLDLRSDMQ